MRAPRITVDEVQRIARLAGLALTEADAVEMTAELGQIIDYFSLLEELDPPPPPAARPDDLRDDRPRPGLDHDQALRMAPSTERAYFTVPQVVGE